MSQQQTEIRKRDEYWMGVALQWAEKGRGFTSPRPSVGSVLVRDEELLGAGHTQPGDGQPHAEVMALRAALAKDPARGARGATAYATLEPCSHWGTTPPCCDALVEAGVSRVVVGVTDPNPLVAGRGIERMRAAGLEVECGVLEGACHRTHEEFLHHIVHGTPFVTLKSAVSLDGKIALPSGESRWISGAESRRYAHRLRHINDAVLVGVGTAIADDPSLTVRLDERVVQPVRVVMDSTCRLPLQSRLLDGTSQLVVLTGPAASAAAVQALEDKGAVVLRVPQAGEGLDWTAALEALHQRGICSLLIEGGGRLAGSALAAGVVHKVAFFVAPLLMGQGIAPLGDFAVAGLERAPRLHGVHHQIFGEDVFVSGYLTPEPGKAGTP